MDRRIERQVRKIHAHEYRKEELNSPGLWGKRSSTCLLLFLLLVATSSEMIACQNILDAWEAQLWTRNTMSKKWQRGNVTLVIWECLQ